MNFFDAPISLLLSYSSQVYSTPQYHPGWLSLSYEDDDDPLAWNLGLTSSEWELMFFWGKSNEVKMQENGY